MNRIYNLPNKRAQLTGDAMIFFVAVVFIAILLLVFYFLAGAFAKSMPQKEKLQDFSLQNEMSVSLKAYLETPVVIDYNNEKINIKISELIRLVDMGLVDKKVLEEKSSEIFDKVYPNNYELSIVEINENKNELIIMISQLKIPKAGIEPTQKEFVDYSLSIPENLLITLSLEQK